MRILLVLALCVLMSCAHEESKLSVSIGPTSIPRGDAAGANDITVSNGLFAVAFAVDTAPPWGVARGGIVDISIIRNGELDYEEFIAATLSTATVLWLFNTCACHRV